jgi:hypothetical protein
MKEVDLIPSPYPLPEGEGIEIKNEGKLKRIQFIPSPYALPEGEEN